jgi:selenocysteine lyase/cysteine desulfurase
VAIDYARSWGIEATWERIRALATLLRARLGAMPGVTVRDSGAEQCGIVTFTTEGREPAQMVDKLLAQGINVSFTTVRGTRLDMEARGLTAMVRASVHYYNSEDEIERFCTALAGLPTP